MCRFIIFGAIFVILMLTDRGLRTDIAAHADQQADAVTRQTRAFFARHDRDGDGKLSRQEFPERLRRLFSKIDTDGDGQLTVAEDVAFRRARQSKQPPARGQLPTGVKAHRDLTYAIVEGKELKLDVYTPNEASERRPLIVWIHGGGWRAGSKDRCPALRFVDKGFVVASINYRLSHEAIFPAQIEDCKAAIRWLRANSEKYAIDPKRVGVWGSSAGGHLVALLGTSGGVKTLAGELGNLDQSSRVQAVCDFFGPTDLLQMDAHALPKAPFKHDSPDSPESKLIGGPIQENKEKTRRANPIEYVSRDDPPFLIVHGDQDVLVPLHQSQLLHDALKQAGVDVTFQVVKGAGHGNFRDPKIDKLVDGFFTRVLRP